MIAKIIGAILRIPIYVILILAIPIIYLIALAVTLSFEESNEVIKELFSF